MGALKHIWNLADANKDGRLSMIQFAVAIHLASLSKSGVPLPSRLPPELQRGIDREMSARMSAPPSAYQPPSTDPRLLPLSPSSTTYNQQLSKYGAMIPSEGQRQSSVATKPLTSSTSSTVRTSPTSPPAFTAYQVSPVGSMSGLSPAAVTSQPSPAPSWRMSDQDFQRYTTEFRKLDTNNDGIADGRDAKTYLEQFGL